MPDTIVYYINCKELLVCHLVAESVKTLCGKQVTVTPPYPLNRGKAFLAKSVSQIQELIIKKPMVPYFGSVTERCNS